MGSKISPTVIGAFVVGALVCIVAGVLLFGGGKFFKEKLPYVLFFDSSVEGLNVGAPVIFRGVQVGQVTEITALADPQTFTLVIRVKVELVRGSVHTLGGPLQDSRKAIEGLIQKGARASLRMQSFVTGVLYVAFDFHPDTPIRLLGLDPEYPELPTIPSDLDQLKSTLQQALGDLKKLPLDTLLSEVLALFKRANSLLELPEVKQALVSLDSVVLTAERLLQHADGQVAPLSTKVGGAADAARVTLEMARTVLADAQKLLRNVDGQVTPLAGNANDTLTAARGTLGQAQKSLVKLTDTASPALKQAEQTLGGADTLIHN
jgi:paraquat-inducible protein B